MKPRTKRLLEARAETARSINRLMLALLGLGLVGVLSFGVPDSYFLTTKQTVSIPFAGAASFKFLIILGPVLLIAVRAYLEIYMAHWRRLGQLLRHVRTARVPVVSPLHHPMLRYFSAFILYPLVPIVLGVFTWKAMVFREWGVELLFVTVATSLVLLLLRYSWPWPYRIMAPPLGLLALFVVAEYEGGFESFRRPFELQLADLERSVLAGQNLSSADLRGANLTDSDLGGG